MSGCCLSYRKDKGETGMGALETIWVEQVDMR